MLAGSLIPVLVEASAGTTLNLNVPNVALSELRGLRHGRLSRGGTIRSAVHDTGDNETRPHLSLPPEPSGTLRLDLGLPGQGSDVQPDSDAGLIIRGYASITALVGVREAGEARAEAGTESDDTLGRALTALYAVPGVGPGPPPETVIDEEQASTV